MIGDIIWLLHSNEKGKQYSFCSAKIIWHDTLNLLIKASLESLKNHNVNTFQYILLELNIINTLIIYNIVFLYATMCSFFKTLTTEKGQLYFLTNENDYAPVFNDYFFRSSRFLFRLLRNYVQVKISRNIYNKFSLARYINVPGFINSHLEQKEKRRKWTTNVRRHSIKLNFFLITRQSSLDIDKL